MSSIPSEVSPDSVNVDYCRMLPDDSKVDSFVSDRRKSRWVRLSIPIAAILVSVILAGRRYAAVASNEARLPFEEELALIYLILTILYEFSYFILRLFELPTTKTVPRLHSMIHLKELVKTRNVAIGRIGDGSLVRRRRLW
jgi:hypothetical protein